LIFAGRYRFRVRGVEAPTEIPAPSETVSSGENQEATEQQPEEQPVFAGLTETQLKAKLARIDEIDSLRQELEGTTRKVYGKVGELNGTLQQLQKQPAHFTPDTFKRLREDYPELADALVADMGEAFGHRKTDETQDVDKLVTERVKAATSETIEKVEEKLLTVMHPDWKELANSGEFQSWVGLMKPEEAEALMNSKDGLSVAGNLTKFKTWREDSRKQKATAEEAERQKQDKKRRLEAAALTNGIAPSIAHGAATEEDAYAQARSEAAKRRRRI
jgi:hypothetical protein